MVPLFFHRSSILLPKTRRRCAFRPVTQTTSAAHTLVFPQPICLVSWQILELFCPITATEQSAGQHTELKHPTYILSLEFTLNLPGI